MPFRCLGAEGRGILSFDLSSEAWETLKRENRQERHLRFPCCSAPVVLKTSSRGLRYFAHKARGSCTTAPESEAHLYLKALALEAARAAGWSAAVEVSGRTPAGEEWRADVLAEKGKARVAIEIQWSNQGDEATLARQRRYKDADIRGLWLLRQKRFPLTHDLPAARLTGAIEEGFGIELKTMTATQRLSVEDFLAAAFAGRLRFGIPDGLIAKVSISAGTITCWRDNTCGVRTRVVTAIQVAFGPNSWSFPLDELGAREALARQVIDRLPRHSDLGRIKTRYSRTDGSSYLSNGCHACGAIVGRFYLHEARLDETVIAAFKTSFDGPWRAAVEEELAQWEVPTAWGIYEP